MTRGVEPSVDGESGRGGEDGALFRMIIDCESGGLSGKPPACIGSGMKRGETWTFTLELEGNTDGTSSPREVVPDPDIKMRNDGGEYCGRGNEGGNG